jgi:hypothetical protein
MERILKAEGLVLTGDGRGFAGAVRAQQADGLARGNGETDGIHGQAIAVTFRKLFNLQLE